MPTSEELRRARQAKYQGGAEVKERRRLQAAARRKNKAERNMYVESRSEMAAEEVKGPQMVHIYLHTDMDGSQSVRKTIHMDSVLKRREIREGDETVDLLGSYPDIEVAWGRLVPRMMYMWWDEYLDHTKVKPRGGVAEFKKDRKKHGDGDIVLRHYWELDSQHNKFVYDDDNTNDTGHVEKYPRDKFPFWLSKEDILAGLERINARDAVAENA